MVGEAVTHIAQTALLDILLDRIERLLLGDFEFGVGPARDLDDHVQDALALVGEEGNIVEGRDDLAIVLDVYTVLYGQAMAGQRTRKGTRGALISAADGQRSKRHTERVGCADHASGIFCCLMRVMGVNGHVSARCTTRTGGILTRHFGWCSRQETKLVGESIQNRGSSAHGHFCCL
jgi:hypothetical protein